MSQIGMLARPPLRFALIFLALGLLATAGKVAVSEYLANADDPDLGWPFVSETLGVAAGVLIAAAGLGGLARYVLGPYWTRRTRPIVAGYTQLALDALADIAVECVKVATAAIPDAVGRDGNHWSAAPRDAFAIPDSDARAQHRAAYSNALLEDVRATVSAAGPARELLDAVRSMAVFADTRAERCEALLISIGRYREERAIDLEVAAVELRDAAAKVLSFAHAHDPKVAPAAAVDVSYLLFRASMTYEALNVMYGEVSPGGDLIPRTPLAGRDEQQEPRIGC
jgi:hypothetical protein